MTVTPPQGSRRFTRVAANEETTVLTPVTDKTDALDRIPVSQRRKWMLISIVMAVLMLASVAFTAYLWNVSNDWSAQVDDVTAQNYDLGQRLADEQEQVVKLQADYDEVSEQLKVTNSRILDLTAELNSRDDNAEYYAREINDLQAVLDTASAVTNKLNQCVDYKNQLIERLHHAEDYDPTEIEKFESDVAKTCKDASDASVLLQQAITNSAS